MSERKVLNKYYPPDFDPSKIPRGKRPKNSQQVVRLMAPFSMRCNTCGEYIYKGKKFNARKETVDGEDYFGIRIFRFYIKCTLCSAEITFKTDPKNTDYLAEHGASRNFEPWREERIANEEDRLAKMEEEENNPMRALENRTVDSKREMDILDALQDIRARNARNERVDDQAIQDMLARRLEEEELDEDEETKQRRLWDEEDQKEAEKVFSKLETDAGGKVTLKRKADGEAPDLKSLLSESSRALVDTSPMQPPAAKKPKTTLASSLGIKTAKRRPAPLAGSSKAS
ncbi:hypothetical protein FRC19_006770 [Serendipita sp. 401]|nr:hypothetical protein FRC19_006770 [Serendipita sp. 401]KAG8831886.1 hypothetical protein FRC18_005806 [Serendipita sp. 400]KAG9057593.1 hypothetical protein FS842_005554 [Serendipita sp. 407]